MIQKESLLQIFTSLPLLSLVLLPDLPRFTIVQVKTAYLDVTGRKEKDLPGKGILEAFPDGHNAIRFNLGQSLKTVIHTGIPKKCRC